MSTANEGPAPATFYPEPDLSESYSRTVQAPEPVARAAAESVDLIGPLVRGLIAIGVDDHVVTPCPNGLVWRFDPAGAGRVRIAWAIDVEPQTDESSLVTLSLRAMATDPAANDRLLDAWPLVGPAAELHAQRVLHRIEALAEDATEDPFDREDAAAGAQLRVVS